jgi:transcriptional regulator with XRE-family HTH domain
MEPSMIGRRLRAVRTQRGWSRETLAHHSGVSWSAIAQIESGRRKDVRLHSLSALAEALGVSADYLMQGMATKPTLEHQWLPYASELEFSEAGASFLSEGIERSQALIVVTNKKNTNLLHDALGGFASAVQFINSSDWLSAPQETLASFRSLIGEKIQEGFGWIRILGEPIWAGRERDEIKAWVRFESFLNIAFASAPATILCPYNTQALPAEIIRAAEETHPEIVTDEESSVSPPYRDPEDFLFSFNPSHLNAIPS